MTEPKFPDLPSGMNYPWYGSSVKEGWRIIRDNLAYGGAAQRSRTKRPVRVFTWQCPYLDEPDFDKVMGFLYDRQRAAETFYIDNHLATIFSPYDGPTLTEAAAGNLAQRTWYVAFSWGDGTDQTRISEESTLVIDANKLLTVAVPDFPAGVTQANIYAGTVSGTLYYLSKATTSGGDWTEVETTVSANSASGQKVLNTTITAGYQIGDIIVIDVTGVGGGTEYGEVLTITAGVSLNLVSNLTFTHTLGQADFVNHATNVIGAAAPTTNTITEEVQVTLADDLDWTRGSTVLFRNPIRVVEKKS